MARPNRTWRPKSRGRLGAPKLCRDDESNGLVPLHKLSQWLTYSLFEPRMGWQARSELDGMTGLAEYRNGGLVLDTGLLVPRSDGVWRKVFQPGDLCVVSGTR